MATKPNINEALVHEYLAIKSKLGLKNNDPNGIDNSTLADELEKPYDAIVGFFNKQTATQSTREDFAKKVFAAAIV